MQKNSYLVDINKKLSTGDSRGKIPINLWSNLFSKACKTRALAKLSPINNLNRLFTEPVADTYSARVRRKFPNGELPGYLPVFESDKFLTTLNLYTGIQHISYKPFPFPMSFAR